MSKVFKCMSVAALMMCVSSTVALSFTFRASKFNLSEIESLTRKMPTGRYQGVDSNGEPCVVSVHVKGQSAVDYASWRLFIYNKKSVNAEGFISGGLDFGVYESSHTRIESFQTLEKIDGTSLLQIELTQYPSPRKVRPSGEKILGGHTSAGFEATLDPSGAFTEAAVVQITRTLRPEGDIIVPQARTRRMFCRDLTPN